MLIEVNNWNRPGCAEVWCVLSRGWAVEGRVVPVLGIRHIILGVRGCLTWSKINLIINCSKAI